MSDALLLSGGIDSTCVASIWPPDRAVVIDYGQVTAAAEIKAARRVGQFLQIPLTTLTADCRSLGAGLLAGAPPGPRAPNAESWPFRNQLLVTLAAMWGVGVGITTLVVGTVCDDAERHRDGSSKFVEVLDTLLALQEGKLRLRAPAIALSSAELLERASLPNGVLSQTHSCHRSVLACGQCPGCEKRTTLLADLGL